MKLWSRHRLDVGVSDLLFALRKTLFGARARDVRDAEGTRDAADTFFVLSVRSGFDLVLSALDLPPGSVVFMSAITHPSMAEIASMHGLEPVALDLDLASLEIDWELAERTARARASSRPASMLVAAPLFGASMDYEKAKAFAKRHGLFFVLDLAQAYRGEALDERFGADVAMRSFGFLKTSTALGGGSLSVSCPVLAARARERLASYPPLSRFEYLSRIAKAALLVFLSIPLPFGAFAWLVRFFGFDLDRMLHAFVRGSSGDRQDLRFAKRLRRRPSSALVSMLRRRIENFRPERLARRTELGKKIREAIADLWLSPFAKEPTHWLLPITPPKGSFVEALRREGFDAAQAYATSAISSVSPAAKRATGLLNRMVFLPCYPDLSDEETERLCIVLKNQLGESVREN